ncbi:SH3 domain-containing protein [Jannaschia sp. S6380]|uniref:SH3 domain-containing protein n=1 Tax=Jannaschia sp. S6380 TaxID=2926408 RepID=UPI001FF6EAC0|nr:SH3 domain-containing protein [Jannaschia sp. S6380]MCK0167422.1 SH3 domain-containing protein [Jannaschia sp. S6380]
MGRHRVATDWNATYDDPISLEMGDELWLTGRTDSWDGHVWVWAKNSVGQEGWIPNDLVRKTKGRTYARMSFSALELTCRQGEDLLGMAERHGWTLCKNADGLVGWVPSRNLTRIEGR